MSTVPRPISYQRTGISTFMLSDINGRKGLDAMKRETQRPTVANCGTCDAPAPWQCLTCEGKCLCDVCVRTLQVHRDHAMREIPVPGSRIIRDKATLKRACSACRVTPLVEPFYECTVCKDYLLCPTCEEVNDALALRGASEIMVHPFAHPMLKRRVTHCEPVDNAPFAFSMQLVSGAFGNVYSFGSTPAQWQPPAPGTAYPFEFKQPDDADDNKK